MNKKQSVGVNDFLNRQKNNSGKTFTKNLSFRKIALYAENELNNGNYEDGYRDGVVLISVKKQLIKHFICPFIKINESTQLEAQYIKRRNDEEPYIKILALNGTPLKTKSVELILYRRDVLKETNEETTDSDWELISFHAIPQGVKKMPMGPITMMRNQLQLKGGTKAKYSSEDWANSTYFWQNYAILKPT